MATQNLLLADFMDVFSGNIHNYGQHTYAFTEEGKEQGKNATVTNKLLTMEQYKAHLSGKMGLGIIPIDAQGDCKFAVIDLDVYDSDLTFYIKAIERNNFPLIPFKSKSGGLHLYLFMKQAVNAKALIDVMQKMSMLLGLDIYIKSKLNRIIEIFPKQHKTSEGGIGNWINLPYYHSSETKQYAIRDGEKLALDEALAYIKEKRRTLTELRNFLDELPYRDGPPCLQTISLLNIMTKNAGRNNFLFSFGVYLKKKDPDFWEQKLFEINDGMQSPLSKSELEGTVIASLRKKDYTYKCLEQPCVDYCRKPLCKTRDFGIGKEGGYFSELEYGKLKQIKGHEPYYEWEVKVLGEEQFKLLRFKTEDEIIKQDAFLRLCFRELHMLPIRMKQSEWFKLINQALAEVEIKVVEAEDDTSPITLFRNLFVDFLLNRAMAQTKEQILNKRVYHDKDLDRYYFRTIDLSDYVFVTKGFRYYAPGELHALLHDMHAQPGRIKTESGKQFRVYMITQKDLEAVTNVKAEVFEAEFKKEPEQY